MVHAAVRTVCTVAAGALLSLPSTIGEEIKSSAAANLRGVSDINASVEVPAEAESTSTSSDEVDVSGAAVPVAGVCVDTPGWTNKWSRCWSEQHKRYWDGCTPGGWTCKGYELQGWCRNGGTVPQWKTHVYAFGRTLNYPEVNCCACGGGGGRNAAPVGYTEYAVNCYSGQGADSIDSRDTAPVVHDAASCAARCDRYHGCDCFVLPASGTGQCFLRSNCRVSRCQAGTGEFNTFFRLNEGCVHEHGECGSKGQQWDVSCCSDMKCIALEGTDTMRCEVAGPGAPAGYTEFEANCYSGKGGDDIDTPYTAPLGYDALACAARCDGNAHCKCFVLAVATGQCFLRASCEISRCIAGRGDYKAFTK